MSRQIRSIRRPDTASDISVVIATFGDEKWKHLAEERAYPSVLNQTVEPYEVIMWHGDTLHDARNDAIGFAQGGHIIICDADDELDEGYVEAMTIALLTKPPGVTAVFQPATLGVVNGVEDEVPVLIPEKPLNTGNFLVIGTMFPRRLFLDVGGFPDYPAYEDWACFRKMVIAGASVTKVPDAVYRVHVTPGSRNDIPHKEAVKVTAQIHADIREWERSWQKT